MGRVIFQAKQICKSYPGTIALDHVDFTAYAGSVNILVGENGAGKSTLMKIIAGAVQPTEGQLLLDGEPVAFATPTEAAEKGVGIVYQELDLCPNMTVAENIFLGHEPVKHGVINRQHQDDVTRHVLDRLDHKIDPDQVVGELGVSTQQIVAIAKALRRDAKVLIMDEPTSALSAGEVETLFRLIRDLKAQGVAIIYISHRLEELIEIGDYITVLRDGKISAHAEMDGLDIPWILRQMLGDTKLDVPHHGAEPSVDPILSVRNLSLPHTDSGAKVDNVSFDVKAGEIVGLFGLMGAGRTELLECLMGLHPEASGQVELAGETLGARLGVEQRIDRGMMLIPEDRQAAGIVQTMTLGENISLANLTRYERFGWLPRNFGARDVASTIKELAIKATSAAQMITTLSGGNQQKAIVGKALLIRPRLLLMDEPGRGIDVKAKAEIFTIMNRLATEGIGILFVSSEMKEIVALADRTLVMSEGRITAELARGKYDENDLMVSAARAREAV
ncbi:sugar ABC transporter ATP-binding protein [Solirhodobacter olei]|uniref:sugar ABC transporter ATP-binding protein n=1 Tax=Solirhodobacter olei TaxID=2493082 RepID=UPI000FD8454A|nr:sugar ABC transporter ATP-binding protein [Solirhodobacter olei]